MKVCIAFYGCLLLNTILRNINLRPLHDVTSDVKTRQKQAKKRSLWVINEHFESVFNKVLANAVVVQRSQLTIKLNRTYMDAPVPSRPHLTESLFLGWFFYFLVNWSWFFLVDHHWIRGRTDIFPFGKLAYYENTYYIGFLALMRSVLNCLLLV